MRVAFHFIRDEEGQDLIEYSLLASLISIVCIAVLQDIADAIVTVFSLISQAMLNA